MSATVGTESAEARLQARPHSACFVCGQDNPSGLRIPFERQDDGAMTALWISGNEALTVELQMRFRRPVRSGVQFHVRGWVVSHSKRLIHAEATLTAADGTEHARACARFLTLSKGKR